DHLPETVPIQGTVRAEHLTPEGLSDLSQGRLARRDHLAGQHVGVYEVRAAFHEELRDRALAGGNPACQAHLQHATTIAHCIAATKVAKPGLLMDAVARRSRPKRGTCCSPRCNGSWAPRKIGRRSRRPWVIRARVASSERSLVSSISMNATHFSGLRLTALGALAAAACLLPAPVRADSPVLATVGGTPITAVEIEQALQLPLYDLEMEKYRLT